jgi:hypothetical protein
MSQQSDRLRARVDNQGLRPYIGVMGRGRIILALLVASVFTLRAGDCMTFLLADAQTKDCCKRGKCSPPQKNADPCCQVSGVNSAQHFQAPEKILLGHSDVVVSTSIDLIEPTYHSTLIQVDVSADSPPGKLAQTSLPLLI